MADDLLSQAELETLLSALAANEDADRPQSAWATPSGPPPLVAKPSAARQPKASLAPRETITAYDFRRPQPPADDLIRMLRTVHERFARNFAAALSVMLRTPADVRVGQVTQCTYGEFVAGLDNPTCYSLLSAEPLNGKLFLELSPAILFPVIDRLLGGGGEPSPMVRRPLTEIELRLASRVTAVLLKQLGDAWRSVQPLELSVDGVESNPAALQVVPAAEIVFALSFELAIQQSRGPVRLCIPRNALSGIGGGPADFQSLSANRRASGESSGQTAAGLRQAAVELVARLAETKITSADLFNLHVGDIITTDKDVHSPIAVCLEGVLKFHAHPGAFKGRKAFRIEEALDPPGGAQSLPS